MTQTGIKCVNPTDTIVLINIAGTSDKEELDLNSKENIKNVFNFPSKARLEQKLILS